MHLDISDQHISNILERSDAPMVVSFLNAALEDECRRRQQFYADVTEDMKAEFINGEIVIQSPVKKEHTDVTKFLTQLADKFCYIFNLGYVGFEKVMVCLTRNDYEPDVVFFKNEKAQHLKPGTWKFPPPDFVVEILSESTANIDRKLKFTDYEEHCVEEYWIIDPEKKIVEQYILDGTGKYELVLKAGRGIIESQAMAGFAISIESIFDKDANFQELMKIMAMKKT